MEYGDKTFKDEKLFHYQGFDPANANNTNMVPLPALEGAINQRDADILSMWMRVKFQLFLQSQLTQLFPELISSVIG
jgi:legumain